MIMKDTLGRENRKHADKPCTACGKKFRPKSTTSKYCSRRCLWNQNGGRNRKSESWWLNLRGYIEGRIWVNGEQRRVKQHRWIMERHIGRQLNPNEVVHHINGNKTDNRLENLELMPFGKHSELHSCLAKEENERRVRAYVMYSSDITAAAALGIEAQTMAYWRRSRGYLSKKALRAAGVEDHG